MFVGNTFVHFPQNVQSKVKDEQETAMKTGIDSRFHRTFCVVIFHILLYGEHFCIICLLLVPTVGGSRYE